jgi:hypothetical protein
MANNANDAVEFKGEGAIALVLTCEKIIEAVI